MNIIDFEFIEFKLWNKSQRMKMSLFWIKALVMKHLLIFFEINFAIHDCLVYLF